MRVGKGISLRKNLQEMRQILPIQMEEIVDFIKNKGDLQQIAL